MADTRLSPVAGLTDTAGVLTTAGDLTVGDDLTVNDTATVAGLLQAAGVDTTGSPSGYTTEFRFNATGASAACGLSSNSVTTPEMLFDHRATGNTGLWKWRHGTGAATTVMNLGGGPPASGETAIAELRYHNGTSVVTARVTVGAADSGGAGFKVLRVPN